MVTQDNIVVEKHGMMREVLLSSTRLTIEYNDIHKCSPGGIAYESWSTLWRNFC